MITSHLCKFRHVCECSVKTTALRKSEPPPLSFITFYCVVRLGRISAIWKALFLRRFDTKNTLLCRPKRSWKFFYCPTTMAMRIGLWKCAVRAEGRKLFGSRFVWAGRRKRGGSQHFFIWERIRRWTFRVWKIIKYIVPCIFSKKIFYIEMLCILYFDKWKFFCYKTFY